MEPLEPGQEVPPPRPRPSRVHGGHEAQTRPLALRTLLCLSRPGSPRWGLGTAK